MSTAWLVSVQRMSGLGVLVHSLERLDSVSDLLAVPGHTLPASPTPTVSFNRPDQGRPFLQYSKKRDDRYKVGESGGAGVSVNSRPTGLKSGSHGAVLAPPG